MLRPRPTPALAASLAALVAAGWWSSSPLAQVPARGAPGSPDSPATSTGATPGAPKAEPGQGATLERRLALATAKLSDGEDSIDVYRRAIAGFDEVITSSAVPKAGWSKARRATVYGLRAEALFRIGDLTRGESKRLKAYKAAEAAAAEGLAVDARCVSCLFWKTSSLGRWGETRGVLRSLFLLDDIKTGYQRCLELDKKFIDARLALAIIDTRVPGFAGGDLSRAEKNFRLVLEQQPHHTRAMNDLAELLEDDGREREAIELVQQVVSMKRPFKPGEWRKWDRPRARALLKKWQ